MNWFQKARESFKNSPEEEMAHPQTLQAFSQLITLRAEQIVEHTNRFLDTFNNSLFEKEKGFPIRSAAFATGIIAAAITASFIPGMENPAAGITNSLEAAKIYFSGTGTPSLEEIKEARKNILPALQALSLIPSSILLSELGFHAKDTFKKIKSKRQEPEI